MAKKVRRKAAGRPTAKKKTAKKDAVRRAPRKKAAVRRVKRKATKPAKKRMPKTILPPPEDLVDEYDELANDAEAIMDQMSEYDLEGPDEDDDDYEDAQSYFEGDIEEWHSQRDDFFERAGEVWLGLHPNTDPSWDDLDAWLGKKDMWMDI